MTKTIALNFGAVVVALLLAGAPKAEAQYPTIVQITTPERRIPPPAEVRGREHRATNPYFGLRSSYSNVRQYYSNPVKTIPQSTRTVILPYGGYPVYPYQAVPSYPYGYQRGFRRW